MDRERHPIGDYLIENRAGETDRLRIQDRAWSSETKRLLDAIGVAAGWRCLDLGCGPGGITAPLSERVGATGRVLGLDADPGFIALARTAAPANAKYLVGDAYATGLDDESFDLVHCRFVASTAGHPERLVAEAVRLVRPGGVVAFQEADFHTLRCFPPHPAWSELRRHYRDCFPGDDADPIGHALYRALLAAGLSDVAYRPCLVGVRSEDPWRDYLPATVELLRSTVTGRLGVDPGRLDTLLRDCRAHLADAETVFTSFTLVQVWGHKPDPRT